MDGWNDDGYGVIMMLVVLIVAMFEKQDDDDDGPVKGIINTSSLLLTLHFFSRVDEATSRKFH